MVLVDLALALVVFAGAAVIGLTAILLIKEIAKKDDSNNEQK